MGELIRNSAHVMARRFAAYLLVCAAIGLVGVVGAFCYAYPSVAIGIAAGIFGSLIAGALKPEFARAATLLKGQISNAFQPSSRHTAYH